MPWSGPHGACLEWSRARSSWKRSSHERGETGAPHSRHRCMPDLPRSLNLSGKYLRLSGESRQPVISLSPAPMDHGHLSQTKSRYPSPRAHGLNAYTGGLLYGHTLHCCRGHGKFQRSREQECHRSRRQGGLFTPFGETAFGRNSQRHTRLPSQPSAGLIRGSLPGWRPCSPRSSPRWKTSILTPSTSTTARCCPAGRGAGTRSCIRASTKPLVRTSRLRAIFTESSHGYPTRSTEAATTHIASTSQGLR
jgi:hypothetical protein